MLFLCHLIGKVLALLLRLFQLMHILIHGIAGDIEPFGHNRHGLLIGKFRGTKWSKVFMISSVAVGLSALLFFKYTDFFIGIVNGVAQTDIKLLELTFFLGFTKFQNHIY